VRGAPSNSPRRVARLATRTRPPAIRRRQASSPLPVAARSTTQGAGSDPAPVRCCSTPPCPASAAPSPRGGVPCSHGSSAAPKLV
jgi:hypothetical protein